MMYNLLGIMFNIILCNHLFSAKNVPHILGDYGCKYVNLIDALLNLFNISETLTSLITDIWVFKETFLRVCVM